MKIKKILITWRFLIRDIKKYSEKFKKYNIKYDFFKTDQYVKERELSKIIHKYDGIICGDDEITSTVIDKAKKLRVISKWGTGIDSINKNYAKKKNIKVFNTPGAFTNAVAEHAIGLMLSITRNITFNHLDILRNDWSKRICHTIEGKNIGIIGYGKIGKKIHKLLNVFKPNIIINDIKKISKKRTTLNNLLKISDIIFIACDLNETSKHLIKMKELKIMKKQAILINISRGPIIDNTALVKALNRKLISCAGLDVYETEPIEKNSELLKLDNCIFTSHNAFNSKETIDRINLLSVDNLINHLKLFKD